MELYTESLNRLVTEFAALPGIGKKTAERLAFHVLMAPTGEALRLADAIRDVKAKIRHCKTCYNLSESDLCMICANPKRDPSVVCVVEQPRDVTAIEKTGLFRGVYHVLQGHLNPLEGIDAKDLTVDALLERARSGDVQEILLATNPDMEGDGTALFIRERLAGLGKRVTRLAKGIPVGSNIEFASKAILQDAFEGRREL